MTRDARAEAAELVGAPREEVRVLEPSPPAITVEPWFADDPLAPGGRLTPLTAPGESGATGWDAWVAAHPQQGDWAGPRWLMSGRSLSPPPELAETRRSLHKLAGYVVSPARRRANGKLGLRWTFGGFGTPFFGADEQVRVAGSQLVRERDGATHTAPITSLREAADFVLDAEPDTAWAEGFDVPLAGDLDAALPVDEAAAAWLGDWFGFGTRVLEQLRADLPNDTRPQLWPEHFDLAVSLPVGGAAATFGVSPGDAGHETPYLYVLPGREVGRGGVWNAAGFTGAVLDSAELLQHPIETALAFFRTVIAEL